MLSRHAAATLLVAFVLLILACSGSATVPPAPTNPNVPKNPSPPRTDPPRDLAKEKPDFQWTTAELMKEYGQTGTEFRGKYPGKIVEVSGKVFAFDPYNWSAIGDIITMNLEGNPGILFCQIADREPWAKALPGEQVKIRGRIPPNSDRVVAPLVDCVIVEPQRSSALPITAEQLVRDMKAEPKKYINKSLIVSGEIVNKSTVNAVFVELKGDGQTNVRCYVYNKLHFTIDSLVVGQMTKLVGRNVQLRQVEGLILSECLPITRNVE